MREVYQIDSDGYYIQPIYLFDEDEMPTNCIENMPVNLIKPRWNGKSWEEKATQEEIEKIENITNPEKEVTELKKQLESTNQAVLGIMDCFNRL